MRTYIILALIAITGFSSFIIEGYNFDCINLPAINYNYASITFPADVVNNLAEMDNMPATNVTTDAGATLGRVLFYDVDLSKNHTIACASCHIQKFSFTDTARFSVGWNGGLTPRNSMGLIHARFERDSAFFWDNRAASLEIQTLMPIQNNVEMGLSLDTLVARVSAKSFYPSLFQNAFGSSTVTTDRISKALAQFIRSMNTFGSKFRQGVNLVQGNPATTPFPNFTAQENMGKDLFMDITRGNCQACHTRNVMVQQGSKNIGLDLVYADNGVGAVTGNPNKNGQFSVPSLINIELTAPYMHDGRFKTLEEVIDFYSDSIKAHPNLDGFLREIIPGNPNPNNNPCNTCPPRRPHFSVTEKQALLAFLRTLTDTVITTDVRWSNPFCSAMTNNEAPAAISLTVGAGCTGATYTNQGATQSSNEPFAVSTGSSVFNTVWFKFIAPASGAVRVSNDYAAGTMGSDSRLALYSFTDVNDYSTFAPVASDDDNGVIVSTRSIMYASGLIPGNTYYIQMGGKDASTATGTFCITVDELNSSMISTATGCSAGQNLVSVNDNYTGWLSATDVNGKLIALIQNPSGGATTSTYSTTLNINSTPVRTDVVSGQRYLDRNFNINNASVSNANVRFFFLNTELAALQAADPGVTLANMGSTRQTGAGCQPDFLAANGINSYLSQRGNGSGTGYGYVEVATPGFSNFYLYTAKAYLPVKTFLQGAYSATLSRHKNITHAWAVVMNANALSQPYGGAPFNYPGTENVLPGFFTSAGTSTEGLDWVLLELRGPVIPATVVTRRAAFIRCDGRIVDLDGISDPSFRNIGPGNYHLVIRHRNHLGIRTATVQALDGTLGIAVPALYDFSSLQSQAYQDAVITPNNTAMKSLGGGIFGMWAGNGAIGNAGASSTVRASGALAGNDYLFLTTTTLGGNLTGTIPGVYSRADMNMDGTVRANGTLVNNDYLMLITNVLGGVVTYIVSQHQ